MIKLNDARITKIYKQTISNINFNKKRIKEQHDRLNNNNNDQLLKVYHLQLLKNYKKLNIYLNNYKNMFFKNRYPADEILRLDRVLNNIINNITLYNDDDYKIPIFKALIVNY